MKLAHLPKALSHVTTSWNKLQEIKKAHDGKSWLECISLCNELIKHSEEDFFGYMYRGLCNFELNFTDDSIADLETAFEMLGKNRFRNHLNEYANYIYFSIAWNYRKQRNYELALAKINDGIDMDSKYVPFYELQIDIYEDMEKPEDALDIANKALKLDPKNKDLNRYHQNLVYRLSRSGTEE